MTDKNDKEETGEELSAYEKAALSGDDPRCVPIKLDAPAPEGNEIDYPDYSATDQEIWKILYERQRKILAGRGCREYLEGLEMMNFSENKIPYLGDVGKVLTKATNWQVARVPGLLHEADFFSRLARRVFPSTD